jgi:hypothetical protein
LLGSGGVRIAFFSFSDLAQINMKVLKNEKKKFGRRRGGGGGGSRKSSSQQDERLRCSKGTLWSSGQDACIESRRPWVQFLAEAQIYILFKKLFKSFTCELVGP